MPVSLRRYARTRFLNTHTHTHTCMHACMHAMLRAGFLLDGTRFDSSIARGEPSTFAPNGVIQGWREAMQLMVRLMERECLCAVPCRGREFGSPLPAPPHRMEGARERGNESERVRE